jgi:integrase/recombinase XerD
VLKLVEKRAQASGILKRVCCHSFRATGVTEYMNSGGTIEIEQRIAGHTSPSTHQGFMIDPGPADPSRD